MINKYKIVISEENQEHGEYCAQLFQAQGCETTLIKKDGYAVMKYLETEQPDIVLMDVFMPNLDGLSVIKECKKLGLEKKPLFMVMSNVDNGVLAKALIEEGAAYYFIQPFEGNAMVARVLQIAQANSLRSVIQVGGKTPDLEVLVTATLHQIGVPAHIKGYHYLRHSIILAVRNPDIINSITKQLYPEVAKAYDTTASRVERAIRHAIEVAWDRGDVDILTTYFGYTIHNKKGKPTNSEFVAMISDKIRLGMNCEVVNLA